MANKLHPKGTLIKVDTAGGTTFVAVADLCGIMPPQKGRGEGETTVFESTDSYREWIPGFKMGGEPKLRLRFGKAQYAILDAAFEADVIPNWQFSFPLLSGEGTPSRWTFLAFIKELGTPERSVDGEDVWETEATLKITGKPTFSAGTV